MAAEKKGQTIVIKKIFVVAGHHGGSWKVALADFMTAMMAFFLVMWLLGQSDQTKKAVSDYFSTPSVIEYNFSNFGAELTLEKLFLDLINEPLKAIESFVEPIDKTPNLMDMGSKKVVAAYVADQMTDVAKNVQVNSDGFEFDLIDRDIFIAGTAEPNPKFTDVMSQIQKLTVGLQDSKVMVSSFLFNQSVLDSSPDIARKVASQRADLLKLNIQSTLEHPSTEVNGIVKVEDKKDFIEGQSPRPPGLIRIKIQQKEVKADGSKARKLETAFGSSDEKLDVYDNFVKQVVERKKSKAKNQDETSPPQSKTSDTSAEPTSESESH